MNNRLVGNIGETIASKFLCKKGFSIIGRNSYVKWGEIDIIGERAGNLYFFEVKYSRTLIPPEDFYSYKKRKRLIRSINIWLQTHSKLNTHFAYIVLLTIHKLNEKIFIKCYQERVY